MWATTDNLVLGDRVGFSVEGVHEQLSAGAAHVGAWRADLGEKLYSVRNNGVLVS